MVYVLSSYRLLMSSCPYAVEIVRRMPFNKFMLYSFIPQSMLLMREWYINTVRSENCRAVSGMEEFIFAYFVELNAFRIFNFLKNVAVLFLDTCTLVVSLLNARGIT